MDKCYHLEPKLIVNSHVGTMLNIISCIKVSFTRHGAVNLPLLIVHLGKSKDLYYCKLVSIMHTNSAIWKKPLMENNPCRL